MSLPFLVTLGKENLGQLFESYSLDWQDINREMAEIKFQFGLLLVMEFNMYIR